MFNERVRRSPRKVEQPKKPEVETSLNKKRLYLLLSFLVGSAVIVGEYLDQSQKPSSPVKMETRKRKELEVDLTMAEKLLKAWQESDTAEDEGAVEEKNKPTTDFRDISLDRELFRTFPRRGEPDRRMSLSLIQVNPDRKYADLLDEDSELNEEFQAQIENLRFDVDENTAHVYVEGEEGTDQVYVFQRAEDEASREFFGWFLLASDAENLQRQILVSGNEDGFDPAQVQDAIRQHFQESLLERND